MLRNLIPILALATTACTSIATSVLYQPGRVPAPVEASPLAPVPDTLIVGEAVDLDAGARYWVDSYFARIERGRLLVHTGGSFDVIALKGGKSFQKKVVARVR